MERIKKFIASDFGTALWIVILWRMLLIGAIGLAQYLFPMHSRWAGEWSGILHECSKPHGIMAAFFYWDGAHYLGLADYFYHGLSLESVFYPLLPMSIKLGKLVGLGTCTSALLCTFIFSLGVVFFFSKARSRRAAAGGGTARVNSLARVSFSLLPVDCLYGRALPRATLGLYVLFSVQKELLVPHSSLFSADGSCPGPIGHWYHFDLCHMDLYCVEI